MIESTNLWTIFATGLLTGGLTCLAVQGGLLATTIASIEDAKLDDPTFKPERAAPILWFLGAKIVAYTLFGMLLGWFGSFFQLSLATQVVVQFLVALFMLATAGNILDLHPLFRYAVIQPPRALTRRIRNQSKSSSMFAPMLLGASTVFIPCGTTQAMMALAIGSGSPITGALILGVFVIGTTPLFFALGYGTTVLGDHMREKFMKLAAALLIILALVNIYSILTLSGVRLNSASQTTEAPVTEATITFETTRYVPDTLTVAAGSAVKLNLVNNAGAGCIQAFVIPKLGIQEVVPIGSTKTLSFRAPQEKGQIVFSCSMGMYSGVINVI